MAAAKGGAKRLCAALVSRGWAGARAYVRRAGESAVHTGVRFCGELCVEDPQRFWQAFASGIGAGKAYGMGMMMLGRAGI